MTVDATSANSGVDPGVTVTSVAVGVSPNQPYTAPTAGERVDACNGVARLAIGDLAGATTLLGRLGFTVTTDVDPATGRRYATAVSETATARAWGLYVADLSHLLGLCIAVPHPKSDTHCEQLALRLWQAVPGSMLAMAAVHRNASSGEADHSQNTASVFHHLWTAVLGPRGVPQVQIHGFADATATEQVVVSTGAGPATPAAVRIADEIAATGLVTTRNWDGTANTNLDAITNQQGIAANTDSWIWVHVELNRTVRDTTTLWQPAIDPSPQRIPRCWPTTAPHPAGRGISRNRSARRTPPARPATSPARTTSTAAPPIPTRTPSRWSGSPRSPSPTPRRSPPTPRGATTSGSDSVATGRWPSSTAPTGSESSSRRWPWAPTAR